MDKDKLKFSTTTDGQPPRPGYENSGAPAPINPKTGQHEAYWVLSEAERAKGFLRPVRYSYVHKACGVETRMGQALCETYARDPKYYGATMCVGCGKHFPLVTAEGWQFFWEPDGDPVGANAEEAQEFFAGKKAAEAQKHMGAGI